MIKKRVLISLLFCLAALTISAIPYNLTIKIQPEVPTTGDEVSVFISGVWSDSCVPRIELIVRSGNTIFIRMTQPDPMSICATVMTPFNFTVPWGILEEGSYRVDLEMGESLSRSFIVTDKQFIPDKNKLIIPEAGSGEIGLTLYAPPSEEIRVDIAITGGDPDFQLTTESLSFNSTNYNLPQTITLEALADSDFVNGEGTLTLSAPGYVDTIIALQEEDNDVPVILYVDPAANGNGTGISWADAFNTFGEALNTLSRVQGIREVRLAGGIYKPGAGENSERFKIVSGVTYRGSYAGVHFDSPDLRSFFSFPTILSGDINGDDGPGFTNRQDNTDVVVAMENCSRETIMEGFIISGGESSWGGGGIFIKQGAPVIKDSIVKESRAHYGGGIHIQGAAAVIHNCLFISNSAALSNIADGGGVYINGLNIADVVLTSSTIAYNIAGETGGGIRVAQGNADITDTIIWGNNVVYGDPAYNQVAGDPRLFYSCLQDGTDLDGTNITGDPLFASNYLGSYFLSNLLDQGINSPCLNAGSDDAGLMGMRYARTTSTSLHEDEGIIDMGFHYPDYMINSSQIGDVDYNGKTDIVDALRIASAYVGLDPGNFIYENADYNADGRLNIVDALMIAQYVVSTYNSPL